MLWVLLTQYSHYTDRTINGTKNLLMKIDKSSPKCRAGSREAQTNTLRLLQPHTPLSPPALCEPGCLSQLSDLTGPTGSRRQKQNTKHYVRVTCHDFYTRKCDEIKSVGILFVFLFFGRPFCRSKPSTGYNGPFCTLGRRHHSSCPSDSLIAMDQ